MSASTPANWVRLVITDLRNTSPHSDRGVHEGRHNLMIADLHRWALLVPFGGALIGSTRANQRRLAEPATYKL
jgi:hypothetical protein